MSTYHLEWGGWDEGGRAEVSTVEELDAVLDRVADSRDGDGCPYKVGVFAACVTFGPLPVGLEITLIRDVTPLPHNGCRPPKRRRV